MKADLGLTSYLLDQAPVKDIILPTEIPNLSIICRGPDNQEAHGRMLAKRLIKLVEEVRHQYDLVLFDTPPVLGISDGALIASIADHTVLVVHHRRFPQSMLKRVSLAIQNAGGSIMGVVLNNVERGDDPYVGYYEHYYTRQGLDSEDEPVEQSPSSLRSGLASNLGRSIRSTVRPSQKNGTDDKSNPEY